MSISREFDYDPLQAGIGCLTRLLGVYILIVATITYFGVKAGNSKDTQPSGSTPQTVEDTLPQEFIVISCNDKTFAVDYRSYQAFKNSDAQVTLFVDTTGKDTEQTYVNKDEIEELGVFPSYKEAAEYIAGLENQTQLS